MDSASLYFYPNLLDYLCVVVKEQFGTRGFEKWHCFLWYDVLVVVVVGVGGPDWTRTSDPALIKRML